MPPELITELMLTRFPTVQVSALSWIHLPTASPDNTTRLESELVRHFGADLVLFDVNREPGAYVAVGQAIEMVRNLVGKRTIRIANARFTAFAMIMPPGAFACWSAAAVPIPKSTHRVSRP